MLENHETGLDIVNLIIEEQSWDILDRHDLRDSDFRGRAQAAISFLRKYYKESSTFPPRSFMNTEVGWEFNENAVTESFAIERFKANKLQHELMGLHDNSFKKFLQKGKPYECLEALQSGLRGIAAVRKTIESYKATALERTKRYDVKQLESVDGIIPPYPTLQKELVVYENGTLNCIAGKSSSGKSWACAIHSLYAAFEQGKRVLHVTMENTLDSISTRMDAIHFQMPYRSLKDCIIDYRQKRIWEEDAARLVEEEGDIFIADNSMVRTVGDISQLVDMKCPDFVVIDGAYLLQSDAYGNSFEKSSDVINQLFMLAACSNIPFFCSLQLNPSVNTSTKRDVGYNTRGNKNWYINCSTFLEIAAEADDFELRQARYSITKNREQGDSGDTDFVVHADRFHMNFDEKTEHEVDQDLLALSTSE
jgi:hypothetical protein